MRILIVDDQYVTRAQLKSLFSNYADCDCVPDAEIALLMIDNAYYDGLPYAIITVDLNLPGMNGLELINQIRKIEVAKGIEKEKKTKIIIITSDQNFDTALANPNDFVIIKPVTAGKFESILDKVKI